MAKNIFILITIVFITFFPCLQAGFLNLDDDTHIVNNPALHDLSIHSVKLIFTQTPNKTYIPVTTLSFAVEKFFFGFDPFVFHLDNLLLYAGVVVLVLLLARRMGLSAEASFLATLIFAIHPMKVESVAWATERKDLLYSFFYLLALHQYWSYLQADTRSASTLSKRHYFGTFIFGLLSILAKPMALSLPLILFVFDWYYGRKFSKRVLIEKMPILLYIIGISWISYALNRGYLPGHIYQGILKWTWFFTFYIGRFLFPFQAYPCYVLPYPVNITHWPYLLSVMFLLGLVGLLVRFYRHKLFVFAFLYFVCSIFFLLSLDGNDFSVFCDRFMFLPSMGICFLIGSWVDRRIKNRWGIMIFYFLLVLMGIKTNDQCRIWHDSISLWDQVILEYPDYYRAYNNRGTAESGDVALNDFNKAIALNPRAAKAYNNRGIIYYIRGDDKRALDDFNKAISINPAFPEPYWNRSLIKEKHN